MEPFLFDDFFVPDSDPGVEVTIPMRGRPVPFVLKRGITLKDKEEAAAAGMTRHIDENGRLVVDGLDDQKVTAELLVRCIKSWPFTHKDGSPVPITAENILSLVGDAGEKLVNALMKGIDAKTEFANGPFVTGSDAASQAQLPTPNPSDPTPSDSASSATTSSDGAPTL